MNTSANLKIRNTLSTPQAFKDDLKFWSNVARESRVVLVTSLFEERTAGIYHNSAVVFDSDGTRELETYRKDAHFPGWTPGVSIGKFLNFNRRGGFRAFKTLLEEPILNPGKRLWGVLKLIGWGIPGWVSPGRGIPKGAYWGSLNWGARILIDYYSLTGQIWGWVRNWAEIGGKGREEQGRRNQGLGIKVWGFKPSFPGRCSFHLAI